MELGAQRARGGWFSFQTQNYGVHFCGPIIAVRTLNFPQSLSGCSQTAMTSFKKYKQVSLGPPNSLVIEAQRIMLKSE
jgi:hypothetical protein